MSTLEFCVLPLLNSSLLQFLTKANGQVCFYCNTATNYSSGSVYQNNVNLVLLPCLVASASTTGFNMTTAGQEPDVVYGLIQYRPDMSKGDCQTYLSTSALEINKKCPNQKEAFILYDNCSLHYSDWRFFSSLDRVEPLVLLNTNDMINPVLLSDRWEFLFWNLSSRTASSPSLFYAGSTSYTYSITIYGMMQCTRDLTEQNCF